MTSAIYFFFNDTASTEIYTLSLHDALPISVQRRPPQRPVPGAGPPPPARGAGRPDHAARRGRVDRKSTRLNSSHVRISYAVFCLKKKKTTRASRKELPGDPTTRSPRSDAHA